MAENNAGTWVSVDVDFTKLIEEYLDPVFDGLETILELVLTGLNILQSILQIVKAFIVGLLDPLKALLEALIADVRAFIEDIRRIGAFLYVQEMSLVKAPYEGLKGGFNAFKTRMITAHVDSTDPTRPVYSSSTSVIGVYFYLSVQVQDIFKIIEFVRKIALFFSVDNQTLAYPAPTGLTAAYGTEALGLASFSNLGQALSTSGTVDRVVVKWNMPIGVKAGAGSYNPAPAGFILDVCTSPSGYQLVVDVPNKQSTNTETTRQAFPVVDPKQPKTPLFVFGGLDAVRYDDQVNVDGENKNASSVYLFLDQTSTPVSVSQLYGAQTQLGRKYLGASFYVKNSLFQTIGPGQGFAAVLDQSRLPVYADFDYAPPNSEQVRGSLIVGAPEVPSSYAVQITAVDQNLAALIEQNLVSGEGDGSFLHPASFDLPRYTFTDGYLRAKTGISSKISPFLAEGEFSPGSQPLPIVFPGGVADAIRDAIIVALLSRIDLPTANPPTSGLGAPGYAYRKTGMEPYASSILATLGFNPSIYELSDPIAFRRKLKTRINRYLTLTLSQKNLKADLIAESEQAGRLAAFRWSDLNRAYPSLTLAESLDDTDRTFGIFPNPSSALEIVGPFPNLTRSPSFLKTLDTGSNEFVMGQGTADWAPVILAERTSRDGVPLAFCRNEFLQEAYPLQDALYILTLVDAPPEPITTEGRWKPYLLFPQGWPEAEAFFSTVEKTLQTILDSLEGVSDAIIAYIDAISARITQLQALIVQLEGFLNSLRTLKLGGASVLVLIENGSDGLLTGFVNAENQPADSLEDYGFGFALVAGGVPAIIADLLVAIFNPEE